jgi:hypothetical protein
MHKKAGHKTSTMAKRARRSAMRSPKVQVNLVSMLKKC